MKIMYKCRNCGKANELEIGKRGEVVMELVNHSVVKQQEYVDNCRYCGADNKILAIISLNILNR
jgi:hypothetical protein